jgi:hypothetical protein
MEIASVQECGCVIHELFAGAEDKTTPSRARRSPEFLGLKYRSTPVHDPLRGTYYPSIQQPYSAAKEEHEEAVHAARMRAKYPPEAGFGSPLPGDAELLGIRPGKSRKGMRSAKSGGKGGRGVSELSFGEVFDAAKFQQEMERRKVNLGEFRGAIRAGGFNAVHLVAQGPFFLVQAEPQPKAGAGKPGLCVPEAEWLTLVTTRNRKNHMFLNPTAALAMLKGLGVTSVQVDLESWRPNQGTDNDRRRPDMTQRLRLAHEYARAGSGVKTEESS